MRWINFYSDGNEVLEGTRVSFGTWEEVICWSGLFIVYQAEHWREDTHIPCWVCVCVWKTAWVMHYSWNLGMPPKTPSQLKRLLLWFAVCWVNARKLGKREQEGCQVCPSGMSLNGCLSCLLGISILGLKKPHCWPSRERSERILASTLSHDKLPELIHL